MKSTPLWLAGSNVIKKAGREFAVRLPHAPRHNRRKLGKNRARQASSFLPSLLIIFSKSFFYGALVSLALLFVQNHSGIITICITILL